MDSIDNDDEEWFESFNACAAGKLANYNQITDKLYLGGYRAAELKDLLENTMKVNSILTIAKFMEQKFADTFSYKVIEVSDDVESDIQKHFRECIKFLEEEFTAERTVYVHCA